MFCDIKLVYNADAAKFRAYIHRIQHPGICDPTRVRTWNGWRYGLGSQMHVLRNNMLLTLAKQETFLSEYTNIKYVSRTRCKTQALSSAPGLRCFEGDCINWITHGSDNMVLHASPGTRMYSESDIGF